jgi:hypothetical protein
MDSQRARPSLAPTGDPRVDAAIGGLASLEDVDLAERPAVLEGVHDRLREILGELGDPGRPGPAVPARPDEPGRPGEPGRHGEQDELVAGIMPRPGPPRPGVPGPATWPRRPNA